MIHIENERLLICTLKDNDLQALKALRNCEIVYRYEPSFLLECQDSAEEALKTLQDMDLFVNRQCILGVYEKEDPGTLVGLAEFYDFKPFGKIIWIGYRFLPKYWGKGIATSCVRALLRFLKNEKEVQMVSVHVLPDNKASARCLIKNGFEYLISKKEDWGDGKILQADVYTLDC